MVWGGRILGLLAVGFVALFVVGEGPPDPLQMPLETQLQFLGFALMAVGFLIGWWREGWGGAIAVAGFVLFCAVELAVNGTFPGGVIPLFIVPGALLCGGALWRRTPPDHCHTGGNMPATTCS